MVPNRPTTTTTTTTIMPSVDTLAFNISSFIAGLFLLEYGADKFIDHTAIVAKRLKVSPTLVGLLTCGAEWEELVVIAVALGQKNANLAVGNLMGSSIANILASFSLGLLFMDRAEFDRSSKIYSAVLLAVASIFLLFLLTIGPRLKFVAGVFLMVVFVVYVVSVCSLIYRGTLTAPEDSDSDSSSDDSDSNSDDSNSDIDNDSDSDIGSSSDTRTRRDDEERQSPGSGEGEEGKEANQYQLQPLNSSSSSSKLSSHRSKKKKKTANNSNTNSSRLRVIKSEGKDKNLRRRYPKPMHHHILRLVLGLGALLVSSYIIAHSASTIGRELSLSSTVVGTTILSLATTLPEKFVAILGGARHQPGIMIANTVGSNIFLATLCGGVLFVWGDIGQLQLSFTLFEALVMWLSAVLILGVVLAGGRRWMGVVMLLLYIVFLAVEIANGRELDGDD